MHYQRLDKVSSDSLHRRKRVSSSSGSISVFRRYGIFYRLVLIFDNRNIGSSTAEKGKENDSYTVVDMAEDVIALIKVGILEVS